MAGRRSSIRTNDPAGMRNRVLDVASAALQARGLAATSTHDIVRAAGITGGALHHHFRTKRDIALAVLAERVAPELDVTWRDAVRDAPSARAGILAVFDGVADALEAAGRVSGCPLGNLAVEFAGADETLRAAVAAEYYGWRQAIADRLRADYARYAPDPDGFAAMVVALFTGAMAVARAEQNAGALRASAAQLRILMPED